MTSAIATSPQGRDEGARPGRDEVRIDCGVCILRSWRSGDEDSLVRNANNRKVWLNMRDLFPHPYTRAHAVEWIRIAPARDLQTNLAVDVGGSAVGGIGLRLNQDVERISAEIGYWLGEEYWGRGIMTAAVGAMTDHAFAEPGLERIYALPFATNTASLRVLEKVGYTREAILRRSAIKEGVILDQALYARVRSE